jgi:long-chain-fatty-acid--CoA ligase ACSBG
MYGPDRIVDTNNIVTWDNDGYTKIQMRKEYPANIEAKSLVTLVKEQCQEAGDSQIAFQVKRGGKWIKWSFADYYKDIKCVARAFVKLGLEERKTVCVQGFNSPEWFLSCQGAVHAGGICAGLYPTNNAETNKFILEDCMANILVVEDEKMAKSIEPYRNQLPNLKCIIVYDGKVPENSNDIISWQDLMRIGKEDTNDDAVLERQRRMAVNECAILVYTSGTTGNPKGVMLSHDNVIWTAKVASRDVLKLNYGKETIVSYLPLSHIAGQMMDIWVPIVNLSTVIFADKMALKGTLLETLQEARPTVFFGVPRVWEKIMEGMKAKGRANKGLKKKIGDACKKAGLDHHVGNKDTLMYTIGQKAVYSKVREALGLDRCTAFFSGAAPISGETIKYFLSLDMVVHELYGMSEVTGPQSLQTGPRTVIGSVGPTMPGCETRLANKDADGNGEICMKGRNLMMGYLNREDKTTEDIDQDGWLHSGDIGSIDANGFIFITGRIKELIITAGGENVAPIPVEEKIKECLPCISNCILIGDKQKYLSCFLSFKVVVDRDNNDMPTNALTPETVEWCRSIGSNATKVTDILNGPDAAALNGIQAGIDKANKAAISRASVVQKWTVLPLDISLPTGELGPTLKLKRFAFNKKYDHAIERLYA